MARTTSRHRCTPSRPCYTNRKVAAIFQHYYSGGGVPTNPVSEFVVYDLSSTSISLSWSKSGEYTLILASTSEITDSPQDGVSYSVDDVVGGSFVCFNGKEESATISELSIDTVYHFKAFPYNGSKYKIDAAPDLQISTLTSGYQSIVDRGLALGYITPVGSGESNELSLKIKIASNKMRKALDVGGYLAQMSRVYQPTLKNSNLENFAKISWKDPVNDPLLTYVGNNSYGPLGFTTGGDTSNYINSGFVPNSDTLYQQNDAGFGVYLFTNTFRMGCADSDNNNGTVLTWTGSVVTCGINQNSAGVPTTPSPRAGYYHAHRNAADSARLHKDGTQIWNVTTASDGRSPEPFALGAIKRNNVSGGAVTGFGFLWFGSNLRSSEAAIRGILNDYLEELFTPEGQSTNIQASNYGETTLTLSCEPGPGPKRLWVARLDNPIADFPQNGTVYTPDLEFGSGDDLGNGTFVLSSGTDDEINITGLEEGHTLYVRVFDYDDTTGEPIYITDEAEGNPAIFFFDGLEYGDMEAIHSSETYNDIRARRLLNWDKFKTRVNANKTTSNELAIEGRLELYKPEFDSITIDDGEAIELIGDGKETSQVVMYPFTPREHREYVFDIKYGGTIKCTSMVATLAEKPKFEVYNVILKKDGDSKKIQIVGDVRPEFWTDIKVNTRIFYAWGFETTGDFGVVASWNAEEQTITLASNINAAVSNDMNGQWVNIALFFKESISLSDYNQYGDFWYMIDPDNEETVGMDWWNVKQTTGGNEILLEQEDTDFLNFLSCTSISCDNLEYRFIGDCVIKGADIGVSFFTGDAGSPPTKALISLSSGGSLVVEDNGYVVKGLTSKNTASMLLGSGFYIHPNVEHRFEGGLYLLNNTAGAYRQYSGSGPKPIQEGAYSEFAYIEGASNGEYDLLSSNSLPTIIHNCDVSLLKVGGDLTINGGSVVVIAANTAHQPASSVSRLDIKVNNAIITGRHTYSWAANRLNKLHIEYNNCTWKSVVAAGTQVAQTWIVCDLDGLLKEIKLVDCKYEHDPSSGVSLKGEGSVASMFLMRLAYFENIIIDNLTVDAFECTLFSTQGYDSEDLQLLRINDSQIDCSRFLPATAPDIPVESILALGDGETTEFTGASIVFDDSQVVTFSAEGADVINSSYSGDNYSVEFNSAPANEIPVIATGILRKNNIAPDFSPLQQEMYYQSKIKSEIKGQ